MGVTTIRLQPEAEAGLDAMVERSKRSRNWLINEAIKEYVVRQDLEQARWAQTVAAMEAVAQGKVVSGDAMHRWLESWGDKDELPPPKVGE